MPLTSSLPNNLKNGYEKQRGINLYAICLQNLFIRLTNFIKILAIVPLAKVFVKYALFSCQKHFPSSYGLFNLKLQLEAFNSFVFVFLSLFLNIGIPLFVKMDGTYQILLY